MSSECARHPGVAAVDLCARCGAFVCGDCVEYQRDQVPTCLPCLALVREVPAPVRAKGSTALAAGSFAALLAGFLVKGRPGLWLWGAAAALGAVGLIWAALEWRRLRGLLGVQRGLRWVRVAMVLGALSMLGFGGLVVAFFVFVRR